jgi:hypothetical protein
VYDSAIAGKQAMTQGNAGQGDRHVGNKSAGQNYPTGQGARSASGGQNNNLSRYPAHVQHQQQQGARYAVQHQGEGQPRHKMMEILPLRGHDTRNLSNSSISRTSSMSNTSKTSRCSSKT